MRGGCLSATTDALLRALEPEPSGSGLTGVAGVNVDPVDTFVADIIRGVDADMRYQPASMVYELIALQVQRRLPGIAVDHERLRDAAARIACGRFAG